MATKEVMDALYALKRDTGIDYTHADSETQEEQADLYLAVVAAQQAKYQPRELSEEEKADRAEQHMADVYNRHARNGWQQPKEYQGIEWDRIVTVKGAAEALGVTRGRIHQLINNLKLDAMQVDGIWLIDKASVDARLESQMTNREWAALGHDLMMFRDALNDWQHNGTGTHLAALADDFARVAYVLDVDDATLASRCASMDVDADFISSMKDTHWLTVLEDFFD